MNEILHIHSYSPRTARLRILNEWIARSASPGQFVIVRFSDNGERIPFSIVASDVDNHTIDIIIHRAAGLQEILESLKEGTILPDVLGPLGKPATLDSDKTVLCVGDGAGFVPLLPLLKALKLNGCRNISVISEESDQAACLLPEIEQRSDSTILAAKGKLIEILTKTIEREKVEKIVMAGPSLMLKEIAELSRQLDIPADCILNMLMIDGIGICGVCRVIVDGKMRQTCTDGPMFDARLVDFEQLVNRQRHFK